LYHWVYEYEKHKEHAFPGSGNKKSPEAEIAKLKKQIADLEEETKILKKAAAFFARPLK